MAIEVGIIGCGGMGRVHARHLAVLPGVRLRALRTRGRRRRRPGWTCMAAIMSPRMPRSCSRTFFFVSWRRSPGRDAPGESVLEAVGVAIGIIHRQHHRVHFDPLQDGERFPRAMGVR